MAAEPCVKCGKLRKVDIIWTPQGWLQPGCVHCGDPGYLEPLEEEENDGDNDPVLRDSESRQEQDVEGGTRPAEEG